jgi:hypothetical protein
MAAAAALHACRKQALSRWSLIKCSKLDKQAKRPNYASNHNNRYESTVIKVLTQSHSCASAVTPVDGCSSSAPRLPEAILIQVVAHQVQQP